MSEDNEEMVSDEDQVSERLIEEIISLERKFYFEKRNVVTERQRAIREIIEKYAKTNGGASGDS